MGSICKENIEKKSTKEDADNHLSIDLTLGDVIWVKINKTSWWPAQVFNEDSMSCNFNPIKKADSDVLVRLYGSYRYLYVDPVVSRSEFASILLENKGKYDEIMMKTLKKDLARVKYGRSKGERAEPKERKTPKKDKNGMVQAEEGGSRKRKQGTLNNLEPNGSKSEPTTEENLQEQRSARRMKIMQRLGLIAPPDSPFRPKYMNQD